MAPAKEEVFEDLGLTVKPVPKDGACAFHALSFWFQKGRKPVTSAAAIRAQTVDHLEQRSSQFEPHWDRIGPVINGEVRECATWSSCISAMRVHNAWAGELDLGSGGPMES